MLLLCNFVMQVLQSSAGAAICAHMQKRTPKTTTARTYRLDTALYRDLKQLQEDLDPSPNETAIVQSALRQYIDRKRGELRGASR